MEEKSNLLQLTMEHMLEHTQDMIFVKDADQKYVTASRPFLEKVGCSNDRITGKTDFDLFDEELAGRFVLEDEAILKSKVNQEDCVEQLAEQEGEYAYASISKYVIEDEEGNVIGLYGVIRDVTATVILEKERELKRHTEQMFDCVIEADLTEDKMFPPEGESWLQNLHITEESTYTEVLVRIANEFIHPSYKNNFLALYEVEKLRNDYEEDITEFQYVAYTNFTKDRYRWTEFKTRVYFSRFSGTLKVLIFLKDVDQEVKHREQLQKKAMTDALTGLSNRGYMLERITDYISQEIREAEDLCALLFIDLDDFKQVNDTWGHKYGDMVLLEAAKRLQNILRDGEICGRLGGDEFLVFLKGVATGKAVEDKAKQLLRELEIEFKQEGAEVKVTCSIGIAMCNNGSFPVDLLMQNADRAMLRAKEKGKNQIYFYDDL